MSYYNTELRTICESLCEQTKHSGYNDVEEIIDTSALMIFDFDFPTPNFVIESDGFKKNLAKKIIRHYYTREIGLETYGLFKLKLRTKLNEIMPYYCKLYESETLKFNPFFDTDITTDRKGNRISNSSSDTKGFNKTINGSDTASVSSDIQTTNTNTDECNKYSDTPQGSVNNLRNDSYLTNARIIEQDNSGVSNGTNSENSHTNSEGVGMSTNMFTDYGTSMDNYLERISGKRTLTKTYSEMLVEYRNTFLNIDMMIIDELKDLFMLLW